VRFHWYWPFARPEELGWAHGTARPTDRILVEVIDRPQAPTPGTSGAVTVVRDLPDVDRSVRGPQWLASRASTYARRARIRQTRWQSGDFDLLHLHYLNRFTDVLAPLPHPLVISVHDVEPHLVRLGPAVESRILGLLYHRADGLVVHHQRLADRLITDFDVSPDRIHVVPHQVFPAPPAVQPAAGPTRLLMFGALRPNKGLEVLAAALRRLPAADVAVVIAGRGDEKLEQRARRLAMDDTRVRAEIGFVPLERKRELLSQSHVVVLPYTSFASQSGVLHDAYSHHRPVVVTDVGALGDTVREDGTGLVALPNDPVDLAAKIEGMLDADVRDGFAAAAAAVARQRTPDTVGRALRAVYDRVLGT
jgi:glycosyltransferase involved in cell wall biosynthesis